MVVVVVLALGSPAQQQHSPLFTPAPGSPFPVGTNPNDVILVDVNGDGMLDILTANEVSNDISVLLGKGDGGFHPAPGSPVSVGPTPHLLAAGKLNDGRDLALAATSHDSNDVVVLLGDGNGGFSPAPGSPFAALREAPPHNHGLALVDVNGDRSIDIIATNQDDNSVSVLLGDGRGGFQATAGSPFAVGRMPYLPALGDLNRDNNLDIAVPNARDDNVTVLLGDGKGGYTAARGSPYPVEARPYNATLGDVNGDGNADLVTTHSETSLVTILLGDGRGGFKKAPGSPFDAEQRGWKVFLGDVNGDSNTDLVTSGVGDAVTVLLGNGRGKFTRASFSPLAVGGGPWGLALGDLNGDGKLDIVTANSESNDVTVLLQEGSRQKR